MFRTVFDLFRYHKLLPLDFTRIYLKWTRNRKVFPIYAQWWILRVWGLEFREHTNFLNPKIRNALSPTLSSTGMKWNSSGSRKKRFLVSESFVSWFFRMRRSASAMNVQPPLVQINTGKGAHGAFGLYIWRIKNLARWSQSSSRCRQKTRQGSSGWKQKTRAAVKYQSKKSRRSGSYHTGWKGA